MYKIKAENLSQKAAEIISGRIIRKEFLPGERLIETRIAGELGVSQGTVREAFRILEKKKLVAIEPRRGTVVTQINSDYIESLYDILAELYGLMIRKVIVRMTPADKEEILGGIERIKACANTEDGLGYGEAMFDIISILLRIAGDSLLEHTITELWQVKRWVEYEALIFRKKELADSYRELLKILETAEEGNADEAVRKIREYAKYEKEIALKVMGGESGTEPV
ncbi:MAG: GntR family transcriptional regulator [Syntrophaceae bacterium]|nr:GntR family transcriptional regulator [Syntrophaceae bacterium]